jgi:hypothetical protein
MRVLFFLSLCFIWTTSQAQTKESIDFKVGFQTIYMPQFTVQEASDNDIRAYGFRLMFSDYDVVPFEFGIQAYSGFGDVSRVSLGFNLAYLLAELQNLDFKIGLGLSRIDLEDVDVDKTELSPSVVNVTYTEFGTVFKPYLELEWRFSKFTSLSLQTSYRVINGEKSVVTSVEATGDPNFKNRVTQRDQSFFYSASGFDVGIGISIIF